MTAAPEPMLRAAGLDALMRLVPEADKPRIERRIGGDPDPVMAERVAQLGAFRL